MMKQSIVTSLVALASCCSGVYATDASLINVPVGLCAGILGEIACDQQSSSTGLINVPVEGCIAALGTAKCDQASSACRKGGSLINVPINICLAVLGETHCQQKSESTGGLINIPINLCLAVLGEADCQDASTSTISADPSATTIEVPMITVTSTMPSEPSVSATPSLAPVWTPSWSHSKAPSVSSSAAVSKHTVTSTVSHTTYICPATCSNAHPTSLRLIPTTTAVASASSSGTWTAPASTSPVAFNAAGRATLSGVAVVFGALCAAAMQI